MRVRGRSLLFQCQSHEFPINLSLVLLIFLSLSQALLLGSNRTPPNRVFGHLSPPSSYFCCLSVRPNCLFPNNVPLLSVPTLCDFFPITLFSPKNIYPPTCQAGLRGNIVSPFGGDSRQKVKAFKTGKMSLVSAAPSSP